MKLKHKQLKRIRDGLELLRNYYIETNCPRKSEKTRQLLILVMHEIAERRREKR